MIGRDARNAIEIETCSICKKSFEVTELSPTYISGIKLLFCSDDCLRALLMKSIKQKYFFVRIKKKRDDE